MVIMSINNIKNTDLSARVIIGTYDRVMFSNSNSEINEISGMVKPIFIKRNGQKQKEVPFTIHIVQPTQEQIDEVIDWLGQEDGIINFDVKGNRELKLYKVDVSESKRVVGGSYTLECTAICQPYKYNVTPKVVQRGGNTFRFSSNGTAESYPIFSFTATSDLSMFGLSHPSGKVIQYGIESSVPIIQRGDKMVIDTDNRKVTKNDEVVFIHPSSQWFGIGKGTTEIGIVVNSGGVIPNVVATFKECYK